MVISLFTKQDNYKEFKMKFSDAMKLVEDGRKVRPVKWPKDEYIYKTSCGLVDSNCKGNNYFLYATDEFEEYIEEVKLGTLKVGDKWRYKNGTLVFLILPKEMKRYFKGCDLDELNENSVICQDFSRDYVDLVYAESNELVIKV